MCVGRPYTLEAWACTVMGTRGKCLQLRFAPARSLHRKGLDLRGSELDLSGTANGLSDDPTVGATTPQTSRLCARRKRFPKEKLPTGLSVVRLAVQALHPDRSPPPTSKAGQRKKTTSWNHARPFEGYPRGHMGTFLEPFLGTYRQKLTNPLNN